jgi:hypothetical protein
LAQPIGQISVRKWSSLKIRVTFENQVSVGLAFGWGQQKKKIAKTQTLN